MRLATSLVFLVSCSLLVGFSPKEDLEKIRVAANVPALGVGVLSDGERRVVVAGDRPDDGGVKVEGADAFHIGSCTKAMTATLAAKYVEAGTIDWDTTFAEAVPDLADKAGPTGAATLKQLLSHTAGLSGGPAEYLVLPKLWELHEQNDRPMHTRRLEAAETILAGDHNAPGSGFEYSNLGYLLAGLMLESANDGVAWEQLVQRDLFEPLGITTAGFGPAPKVGGHTPDGEGWSYANRDNPSLLGPAGTVHLSLEDWLRFCEVHVGGDFLQPASLATLHAPVVPMDEAGRQQYALGWIITPDGKLAHEGSNTFCHAIVLVDIEAGKAIVAATNAPKREASMMALRGAI